MKPLVKGDTIGIIAPASPCDPVRLTNGIEYIHKLGFKTKIALNPTANYGKEVNLFSSDTPINRARALEDLFCDKEIRAILSARGAYGSAEILPYLDFDLIAKNPKPFVGFSDITALLNALNQFAQIPTYHGPMASGAFADALNDTAAKKSVDDLIELLSDPKKEMLITAERIFKPGADVTGDLVGGSLSVITSLIGTPWEINCTNKILFLEDVGEKPYRIHRMLTQLKLSGKFQELRGILLGSFKGCEHTSGPNITQVFEDIFSDFSGPVLAGLPFGHEATNLTLPLGRKSKITDNQVCTLE